MLLQRCNSRDNLRCMICVPYIRACKITPSTGQEQLFGLPTDTRSAKLSQYDYRIHLPKEKEQRWNNKGKKAHSLISLSQNCFYLFF